MACVRRYFILNGSTKTAHSSAPTPLPLLSFVPVQQADVLKSAGLRVALMCAGIAETLRPSDSDGESEEETEDGAEVGELFITF